MVCSQGGEITVEYCGYWSGAPFNWLYPKLFVVNVERNWNGTVPTSHSDGGCMTHPDDREVVTSCLRRFCETLKKQDLSALYLSYCLCLAHGGDVWSAAPTFRPERICLREAHAKYVEMRDVQPLTWSTEGLLSVQGWLSELCLRMRMDTSQFHLTHWF